MYRLMAVTIAALSVAQASVADDGNAHGSVDYLSQIKPLLKARCYACHGTLKQESGLRLDTGQLLRKGSENGPVVNFEAVAESALLERVSSKDDAFRMPPIGQALSSEQIDLLKRWIGAKALSPANEEPEADPADHWAFKRPVRPPTPTISNSDWPRNEIDFFLHAKYDQRGLTPAGDATPAELIRRVYLDLTGLPPTSEQLREFLDDPSEARYRTIVDQLLETPQHGERWARHWMDIWRYSDWYGRRQVNDVRNSAPQIWRWRDWIVDSLNSDKSYARMIQEMLAADEIAPEDDAAWPATGYLIRNYYSLNPNEWMRFNVEYTGKAFLGLTFNCAHCHDHKYDPIAHDDYFRMRAIFEPIGVRQDRVTGGPEPPPFEKYDYGGSRKAVQEGMVRIYDEAPDAPTWFYTDGDERNKVKTRGSIPPGVPAFLDVPWQEIKPVDLTMSGWYPGSRPNIQQTILKQQEAEVAQAALQALTQHTLVAALCVEAATLKLESVEAAIAADNAKRSNAENSEIDRLAQEAYAKQLTAAIADARWRVADAESKLGAAQILPDTDKNKPTVIADETKKLATATSDLVKASNTQRDKPTSTDYALLSPTTSKQSTGRRSSLAYWITDERNPLTPRVAINHIWLRHFHVPLVESVSDFGRNGKTPSHPELLDWLAVELQEHQWSMKHIHRLIVTSRAYRLSSSSLGSEKNLELDSDNRLLWRMNQGRLEAELVRDCILAIAGVLDKTVGGPVLPNTEATKTTRRSLYYEVYPEDGGNIELATIFDAPDPGECFRRTRTIVPQQALALSNSKVIHDASTQINKRLAETLTSANDDVFIRNAFATVLCREPIDQEVAAMTRFLASQRQVVSDESKVKESLIRVLFNHNDFVSIR